MSSILSLATAGAINFADVPGNLRRLADQLEAEATAYGPEFVCRVAIVIRTSGDEPRVHSYGTGNVIPQLFMDLHAGADQILHMGPVTR